MYHDSTYLGQYKNGKCHGLGTKVRIHQGININSYRSGKMVMPIKVSSRMARYLGSADRYILMVNIYT